jgi:[acyl-carrier-protein] S-malonyltransferase
MQECSDKAKGGMFAVLRMADNDVLEICKAIGDAWPANFNCPGQMVVSCAQSSCESLTKSVASKGGRAIRLAVSGAFHSPLMEDASARLFEFLSKEDLNEPTMPLYSNVTGKPFGCPKELLSLAVKSL